MNTRGRAIDTSLRYSMKEGNGNWISPKSTDDREKGERPWLAWEAVATATSQSSTRPAAMLIQPPTQRCQKAGATISTTGDPPPLARVGREGHQPNHSARNIAIPRFSPSHSKVVRCSTVSGSFALPFPKLTRSANCCNGPSACV